MWAMDKERLRNLNTFTGAYGLYATQFTDTDERSSLAGIDSGLLGRLELLWPYRSYYKLHCAVKASTNPAWFTYVSHDALGIV